MTQGIEIAYSYEGVPTIEHFSCSNAFMRGLMGPFGSGNDHQGCVIELVNRWALAQKPGPDGIRRSRWGVIRNTFGELSGTTIKTIFQWLPPLHFGRYIEAKHTYTVRAFPGCEFEFVFIALDRPDDIKRLLSLELTGAWVNEAREVPWSIIEVLQGRVGRYPAMKDGGASWSGVIMDTNPPDSDSSWFKYFEEKNWLKDFKRMQAAGELPANMRPQDFAAIFKQPSGLSKDAENLPNLPGGRLYYSRLATGKAAEWVKVYVDGAYGFVIEGKLVYPEYSDAMHCKPVDPMPSVSVIRSWDWGLTPACAFSQLLPTGQWLTFDEMTSDNMSVDQFSDEVLEKCTRAFKGQVSFEDYGDPAGQNRAETDARSAFDILQAKGIQIEAAFTQEPTLRQEAVRKVLQNPGGRGAAIHPAPSVHGPAQGFHGRLPSPAHADQGARALQREGLEERLQSSPRCAAIRRRGVFRPRPGHAPAERG